MPTPQPFGTLKGFAVTFRQLFRKFPAGSATGRKAMEGEARAGTLIGFRPVYLRLPSAGTGRDTFPVSAVRAWGWSDFDGPPGG